MYYEDSDGSADVKVYFTDSAGLADKKIYFTMSRRGNSNVRLYVA